MVAIDPSINDPTPTGVMAERADAYRVATSLVRTAGFWTDPQPCDVLALAEFLYYGQDS